MSDRMLIGHLAPGRTGPLQGSAAIGRRGETRGAGKDASEVSFQDILAQKQGIRFSHHAEQRLQQRGIEFRADQLDRIRSALDQAAAKGAKDSLLLYRDVAMIVNVPNRTVVTAIDGPSMRDHVFTQIDSAIVVT